MSRAYEVYISKFWSNFFREEWRVILRFAKITGTGSFVPPKVVTNFDLEKIVETSDEWIRQRTGIVTRHICDEDCAASDLAVKAAHAALDNCGLVASDIDLILVATTSPDHIVFPSTACIIQEKIGAHKIPAFDISAACTGFIYGLSTVRAYIRDGMFKRILFISVDTLSKFLNYKDRSTCVLFGDGAGALVIEASDNAEDDALLSFSLNADGSGQDALVVPSGGSRMPFSKEVAEGNLQYLTMDGPAVYRFVVSIIKDSINSALQKINLQIKDVKYFIPHQANLRIIEKAAKKLGFRRDQLMTNIEKYGNTSSASIPLILDEMNRGGKFKKGDIIATIGFGAGFTYGTAIIKW